MTSSTATPATSDSSTLYFGPWYRRSPFFEKTLAAGCSAYDIYNHLGAVPERGVSRPGARNVWSARCAGRP